MDKRLYISVILPLKLEWEPCYWVPASTDTQEQIAEIGQRVKVKFASKEYVGVISNVNITPDIDPKKILPVLSVETQMEKVLVEEIALWRKVAQYYLCTVGEVYKAAYPVSKINLEEARAEAKKKIVERREKVVENILKQINTLKERLDKKAAQLEKSTQSRPNQITKTRLKLEADIQKAKEELAQSELSLDTARHNVEAAKSGLSLYNTALPECTIELTSAQQNCYEQIQNGFKNHKPVLLHGATGSGKTEIYIKAAYEALSQGKNILYLVPEIALSRQLEDRLYEHFEDRLMVFHSGESAAAKRNIAEIIRAQKGNEGNYILLGTRSSLFLPHHNIGLIIVDEEHDGSYTSESAPRYATIDVAIERARLSGAKVLLGSATPSVESYNKAVSGQYNLIELQYSNYP